MTIASFSSFFFLYFKMECWCTNAEIEMSYHLNRFNDFAPKTGFEPESKSNSESKRETRVKEQLSCKKLTEIAIKFCE